LTGSDLNTPTAAEQLAFAIEDLVMLLIRQRGDVADVEPSSLTTTQRLALTLIDDQGSLRLHALAELMGASDPTATRAVDALERERLVARVRDPTDGRAVLISSTARGREAVAARRRHLVAALENGLAALDAADGERLVDLLLELNQLLRNGDRAAAAVDA
jgi:DNA-binding MarR family transcriptional regulator